MNKFIMIASSIVICAMIIGITSANPIESEDLLEENEPIADDLKGLRITGGSTAEKTRMLRRRERRDSARRERIVKETAPGFLKAADEYDEATGFFAKIGKGAALFYEGLKYPKTAFLLYKDAFGEVADKAGEIVKGLGSKSQEGATKDTSKTSRPASEN